MLVRVTRYWLLRLARSFSATGLLIGTLFLAASLTPSLIPRTALTQGIVSGVCLAVGYGIGVASVWLWSYLELPHPSLRVERFVTLFAAATCAVIAIAFLWQAAAWQNSIRLLMEMEPVDGAQPLRIGAIALPIFAVLYLLGWLFHFIFDVTASWLRNHIPPRISHVVGIAVALALFWSLGNGVLINYGLRAADASFQKLDSLEEAWVKEPSAPRKTGSAASLVAWKDLGRTGRAFVTSGPRQDEIGRFLGGEAKEPIRVYVGLNSADTPEERAELALAELVRSGAFKRKILVVVTPTGTGWIDPGGVDSIEYLHRGDIASVAVQYSYLQSWMALLLEPNYGAETARALFNEVYSYWRDLPKQSRPKLYLHGLSLGALNSERSADLYDVIGEPFQGALWAGPPFSSETWRFATNNRVPGSPAWRPGFRDASIIRFTNQQDVPNKSGSPWGPIRIVYLQYASDPITFFDPAALYREPEWMRGRRGQDVSAELQWFPIVTLLQLTVDMASATAPPVGYGHVYAPEDYVEAWYAVTAPEGWEEAELDRLKAYLSKRIHPRRKS
ncbi:MAG: alpha/beta-hydrolase family protein [Rhodovibrionaceae bacterium]